MSLKCGSTPTTVATQISRPLITPKRTEALKNMYSLVGTHSAVKLCRWQKSMLKGQGGCYKWTMYGIRSHQCMEATPNIACANKCLFCWRLNSNPSMKEWKWDVDNPQQVARDLIAQHKALIKNSSGMAGVTPEALEEALQPRHCALSLVGEPIAYPRINEFVHELHTLGMSTFLVNNGQFPEAIERLGPVTQLYLSVDSPTEEKMKILDRPIFPDFWDRFNRSVSAMSRKPGRIVFRLTMIEDFNMTKEDLEHYRTLFQKGRPHFIELKALTPAFSGEKKNFLRITNVPTWERLLEYAHDMCHAVDGGNFYEVACVHEHSKCILLAQKLFKSVPCPNSSSSLSRGDVSTSSLSSVNWNTWIDFDKFIALSLTSDVIDGTVMLKPEDYLLPTPQWSIYGAPEAGFDPKQTRKYTKKRLEHMKQEDIHHKLNCGSNIPQMSLEGKQ
eukprot:Tbor_TRINITY_DN5517_c4_g1::TRINITY_DN5517_c4_g1_i1::g.12571::m.12571/K15449/TYW1; tRNA wybutosine-synthesizing protein 1